MKTIMVVSRDDHIASALAEFVKTVLAEMSPSSIAVRSACSPDEVLDALSRHSIDMLITEHHLAGMTGLDLVRWLSPGLGGTITILLTNDSRLLADPWKFAGSEFNHVLAKPLGRDPLKRLLQHWLVAPPEHHRTRKLQSELSRPVSDQ
jgi:CheY-like chemotaxis protein